MNHSYRSLIVVLGMIAFNCLPGAMPAWGQAKQHTFKIDLKDLFSGNKGETKQPAATSESTAAPEQPPAQEPAAASPSLPASKAQQANTQPTGMPSITAASANGRIADFQNTLNSCLEQVAATPLGEEIPVCVYQIPHRKLPGTESLATCLCEAQVRAKRLDGFPNRSLPCYARSMHPAEMLTDYISAKRGVAQHAEIVNECNNPRKSTSYRQSKCHEAEFRHREMRFKYQCFTGEQIEMVEAYSKYKLAQEQLVKPLNQAIGAIENEKLIKKQQAIVQDRIAEYQRRNTLRLSKLESWRKNLSVGTHVEFLSRNDPSGFKPYAWDGGGVITEIRGNTVTVDGGTDCVKTDIVKKEAWTKGEIANDATNIEPRSALGIYRYDSEDCVRSVRKFNRAKRNETFPMWWNVESETPLLGGVNYNAPNVRLLRSGLFDGRHVVLGCHYRDLPANRDYGAPYCELPDPVIGTVGKWIGCVGCGEGDRHKKDLENFLNGQIDFRPQYP